MAQPLSSSIQTEMDRVASAVNQVLDDLLPRPQGAEARLHEAMRDGVLCRPERLHAFLAVQSGRLFGVDERSMLRVAAATECLHACAQGAVPQGAVPQGAVPQGGVPEGASNNPAETASPTEEDDLTAGIRALAADALLTLSFSILSSPRTCPDPFARCTLISRVCEAVGHGGVVGGLTIERAIADQQADVGTITRLQRMKSGALVAFACETGALIARAGDEWVHALNGYAHDLGLALRIMEDLGRLPPRSPSASVRASNDDATGEDASNAGSPGASAALDTSAEQDGSEDVAEDLGTASFVSLLGRDRARGQAELLARQAVRHLDGFDGKADPLRRAAENAVRDPAPIPFNSSVSP